MSGVTISPTTQILHMSSLACCVGATGSIKFSPFSLESLATANGALVTGFSAVSETVLNWLEGACICSTMGIPASMCPIFTALELMSSKFALAASNLLNKEASWSGTVRSASSKVGFDEDGKLGGSPLVLLRGVTVEGGHMREVDCWEPGEQTKVSLYKYITAIRITHKKMDSIDLNKCCEKHISTNAIRAPFFKTYSHRQNNNLLNLGFRYV